MAKSNPSSSAKPLTIKDFLAPDAIAGRLEFSNKKDVLQEIARLASAQTVKDEHIVFDVLWARECLGTTGVGHGIAIPHGRVPGLENIKGYFVRLAEPITFDAIDDKPVDLIFMLLSPEEAGADHLEALAIVSRLMRDPKLCEQLRRAKDDSSLYRLLTETSTAQAA